MKTELDLKIANYKESGNPLKYFNQLMLRQFDYTDELCDLAGRERLPEWIKQGAMDTMMNILEFPDNYRDIPIKIRKNSREAKM